jgi:hypothetical protein
MRERRLCREDQPWNEHWRHVPPVGRKSSRARTPLEMPAMQPTKCELVIKLKTAALGIDVIE